MKKYILFLLLLFSYFHNDTSASIQAGIFSFNNTINVKLQSDVNLTSISFTNVTIIIRYSSLYGIALSNLVSSSPFNFSIIDNDIQGSWEYTVFQAFNLSVYTPVNWTANTEYQIFSFDVGG